ncbi:MULTISPECIES: class I SAM-dependent methyltransferase [Halolamina]|uniref:Methyltransferase domain-containing protein n=1 Tax=Halolamina pelagica TaxID=699431 RepID=A0A1I5V0I4_9EURY|nr:MULTISPECIES: class I SAM-dependent methyltransferase [Halolamina]NHX36801.1 class I SAM-dependent methyltransferase [Halolamina sp. R1-12]SFQ00837.1 Methyltransferase domain-containing protein [Halolamina pelagica]
MSNTETKKEEIETYDETESTRPSYGSLWDTDHYKQLIEDGPEAAFKQNLESAPGNKRVLFIGVGEGKHAGEFSDLHPSSDITGIELSHNRLKNTKEKYGRALTLARADGEDLPFDADSFDIVVAHAVLHHLPNWNTDGLDEIERVLAEGGRFVFYEPGRFNPPAVFRRRYIPSEIHTPGEKPFNPKELLSVLEQKFSTVEMEGHCLISHTLPVIDNYTPFSIPYRVTKRIYSAERILFDRIDSRLAWIFTGYAEV